MLYLYKSVLRELLLADMLAAGDVQGFLDMGDRLDTLCLMAFNLYLADREQVYAERVAQQRREASQTGAGRPDMAGGKSGRGIGPVSCFPFRILFIVVTGCYVKLYA